MASQVKRKRSHSQDDNKKHIGKKVQMITPMLPNDTINQPQLDLSMPAIEISNVDMIFIGPKPFQSSEYQIQCKFHKDVDANLITVKLIKITRPGSESYNSDSEKEQDEDVVEDEDEYVVEDEDVVEVDAIVTKAEPPKIYMEKKKKKNMLLLHVHQNLSRQYKGCQLIAIYFNNQREGQKIYDWLTSQDPKKNEREAGQNGFIGTNFRDPVGVVGSLNNYLDEITQEWIQSSTFAPLLTVCQSSGFGKTRTMKELARLRVSAFICLRSENKEGVPSRSPELSILFLYALEREASAARFMYAYVITCLKFIQEITSNLEQPIQQHVIASGFFNYQPWDYFGGNVEDNYSRFCQSVKSLYHSLKETVISDALEKDPIWIEYFNKNSLTIFIDEAAELLVDSLQVTTIPRKMLKSKFCILRTIAQFLFRDVPIVIVLTDTNIALSGFEPAPQVFSGSMRISQLVELKQPYFALSYIDQLASDYLSIFSPDALKQFSRESFIKYSKLKTFFCLGRPLWASYISSGFGDIIRYAARKLISANSWDRVSDQQKLSAAIALICTRTTMAPKLELSVTNQLISKHMATLYAVNPDRTRFLFRYISEPVLAEASAWMLNQKGVFTQVFYHINDLLQSGCSLDSPGAVEELVSQVIILRAMDNLTQPEEIFTNHRTVREFLRSLVGPDNFAFLANHVDEKILNATLCFTHFVKKVKQDFNYNSAMKGFVARAAAGQFKDNNTGLDLFIPALLEDGSITYIFFQIKNTFNMYKAADTLWDCVEPKWFRDQTETGKFRRDYLILVLNIGKYEFVGPRIEAHELPDRKETRSTEPSLLDGSTAVDSAGPSSIDTETRPTLPDGPFRQRHAFTLNGLSTLLYPCFTTEQIELLRLILDSERFEMDSLDMKSAFIQQVMEPSYSV